MTRGLPVLGVCRGAQLMAAALGGTLHQHLPELIGHNGHRPEPVCSARPPSAPCRAA